MSQAVDCQTFYKRLLVKRTCEIRVGGPSGRAVKSAVSQSLDHLTAVSGVGSSPALATCETSQVRLAGVPGGFSRGFSRFRSTY